MDECPGKPSRASNIRIDKLLWNLRFAASRKAAQDWVLAGHIRINGQRAVKPAQTVAVGDVLTLPLRTRALVILLRAIPQRRGPAAEALSCYRDISSGSATDSQDAAVP